MHYYQFNINDYLSQTAHLDPIEDLAYRRLIEYYYQQEKAITSDMRTLCKRIRLAMHDEDVLSVINEFFVLSEDGLTYSHNRCDKEIQAYKDKSEKASKSAKSRWNNTNENANAMRTQCERNANQEPITSNQEPITNNKNIGDKSPRPQKKSSKFDFKGELLKVGVSEKNADDWLEVRKLKKQANTDAAFRLLMSEVGKSGLSVDEAVNFAAGMSWAGFKSDWHVNARASPVAGYAGVNKQEALEQRNAEAARKALEQM